MPGSGRPSVRTDFHLGPFRVTAGPNLAIILGVLVFLVCVVIPCAIGSTL